MYKAYIEQVLPQLKITSIEQNDNGQNNDVFIVNDCFVFRFPKYEKGMERLREETHLLKAVQGQLPLPVPKPVYTQLEGEVGQVFVAYSILPGTPLWRKEFAALKETGGIAGQLTEFLLKLHALPTTEFSFLPNTAGAMEELYGRIQDQLFSFMRPDAREAVSKQFEAFLASRMDFVPMVIHGDFGASNILLDTQIKQISGIIDFGGAAIGDPAYDFASLYACYGEAFLQQCLSLYPEGDKLRPRIRFYKETFALQEALHGAEQGDQEAFQSGMASYV